MRKLLAAVAMATLALVLSMPCTALADEHGAAFTQYDVRPSNIELECYSSTAKSITVRYMMGPAHDYGMYGYIEDDVIFDIYVAAKGKSYKHVVSNSDPLGEAYKKIKNLKPNTKYKVKAKFRTAVHGFKGEKTITAWTTPKKLKKSAVKKIGANSYKWKKVKKVKGYVVQYEYAKFKGYNKYGVKVYKRYYGAKAVKKNACKLKSGQKLVGVYPYAKHGKYYYVDCGGDVCVDDLKTKSDMLGMFSEDRGTTYVVDQ